MIDLSCYRPCPHFELPYHTTEVRMIYLHRTSTYKIDTALGKLKLGGEAQLWAVQTRYAVNERLSIIATKDGYANIILITLWKIRKVS